MTTNKTQAILSFLRTNGPASSVDIATALGTVRTKDVTALLKNQILRGEVVREDGHLMINPEWNARLADAKRLLEQAGYQVILPQRPSVCCDDQAEERARIAERKAALRKRMERV